MKKRLIALAMAITMAVTGFPVFSAGAVETENTVITEENDVTKSDSASYILLSDNTVSKMDQDTKREYESLLKQLEKVNAKSAIFGIDDAGNLYLQASLQPAALFASEQNDVSDKEIVKNEMSKDSNSENMEYIDVSWLDNAEGVYESSSKDTTKKFDTFFYNQINDLSQKYFEAGYTAFVENKDYSFRYSGKLNLKDDEVKRCIVVSAVESINALISTYPISFEWFDRGNANLVISYRYNPKTKIYNTNVAFVEISLYWSEEVEYQAQKVTEELVSKAKEYAEKNYAEDIVYGETKYFNEWLVNNNYYNYIGTYSSLEGSEEYYRCHVGYGCLLYGYGVCESYALAMKRLLDAAGIENQYVVGYCSELNKDTTGHAWNYVKMKDGYYYLLDSTWNDNDSNPEEYFLVGSHIDDESTDYKHIPEGNTFIFSSFCGNVVRFEFEKLPCEDYGKEHILSANILEAGKSELLDIKNLKECVKNGATFKSSNPDIVEVSKKGKLKAKKEGTSIISVTDNNIEKKYCINVYKLSALNFIENGKNKFVTVFDCTNGSAKEVELLVKKGDNTTVYADSIRDYREKVGTKLIKPIAKSTKNKVIAVDDCIMKGDKIILRLSVKRKGKAKINVKFGKTKAALKVTVTSK